MIFSIQDMLIFNGCCFAIGFCLATMIYNGNSWDRRGMNVETYAAIGYRIDFRGEKPVKMSDEELYRGKDKEALQTKMMEYINHPDFSDQGQFWTMIDVQIFEDGKLTAHTTPKQYGAPCTEVGMRIGFNLRSV